jgi:hypothetical protein
MNVLRILIVGHAQLHFVAERLLHNRIGGATRLQTTITLGQRLDHTVRFHQNPARLRLQRATVLHLIDEREQRSIAYALRVIRMAVLAARPDQHIVPGDAQRSTLVLDDLGTAPRGLAIGLGQFLIENVAAEHELSVFLLTFNEMDLVGGGQKVGGGCK